MDLKLLREATRPEHEATEAAVPLMGTDLTRESYLAVLQKFHGVILAWDDFARTEAPEAYRGMVQQRRRSSSLEQDIRFLGAAPESSEPAPSLGEQMRALVECEADPARREASFLGAMYVIEGSTLGGQYIAKHVEDTLRLQKGEGDRYFRGYGDQTMPMWRDFQATLRAVPEEHGGIVIQAAKGMFGIFGRWMQAG